MATDILMPALSPTMEQGKLARWLKKEGDPVKPGDVLAEIETDKATMEVEAADEGVLAKIVVPEGTDNVAVNTPIAVLAEEGEDVAAAASRPAAGREPERAQETKGTQEPKGNGAGQGARPASPAPGAGEGRATRAEAAAPAAPAVVRDR